MARLFQIVRPSWCRHGTSIEGDRMRSSVRDATSVMGSTSSSKSTPENFTSSQPRSDHDE